jgi:UDP-glucose 4-epimerase
VDPPSLLPAATQPPAVLHWTPSHSALETILATAWAWHLRRFPAAQPAGG